MTKQLILMLVAVSVALAQRPGINTKSYTASDGATPTLTTNAGFTIFQWTLGSNTAYTPGFSSHAVGVGAIAVCQNGTGGSTITWASPFVNFQPLASTAAGYCQYYTWEYDGTNVVSTGNGLPTCSSTITSNCLVGPSGSGLTTTRTCEVHIWGTGTASVLQDTDDEVASCYNGSGVTETITGVLCWADTGAPTVTPIITGGTGTSILSSALTCGAGSFTAGSLNGTPALSSGGTIDANITTAVVAVYGTYENLDQLTCTTSGTPSCTGTIADYNDSTFGVSVANTITVRNSTCCSTNSETVTSKTGPSGGFYTYTWTNTGSRVGSESYDAGARDQIAKVTVDGGTATNIRLVFTLTR